MPGKPGSVNPPGHYEVRQHQVSGVLGVFWCSPSEPRGVLQMTMGEDRLPLLAAAVATALKGDAAKPGRGVPVQRIPPDPRGTDRVPPDSGAA
jgi:hypothetical protein